MSVSSTLAIHDRMSPVMRHIISSMNNVITVMERLDEGSDRIGNADWSHLRSEVSLANRNFEEMQGYINNVNDAQRQVTTTIEQSGYAANSLKNIITKTVTALGGLMALRRTVSWVKDSLDLYNVQYNAERQLSVVLRNVGAADDAFQKLKETAASIQGYSMYGDEAMLGGAAELATYISDSNAIQSMMGTLANYAAGMSGGGEVGYQQMVEYATQLGKALDGTYDGLRKKGFELSEVQKHIIENGTDMQKALVIDEVISQSWANLSEQMANTPQGQLIQMKNTWGDIREEVSGRLYPSVLSLFDTINENMPQIQSFVMRLAFVLSTVISVIGGIIGAVSGFINILGQAPWLLQTIGFLLSTIAGTIAYNIVPKIWAAVGATIVQIKTEWMHIRAIMTKQTMIVKTTASVWAQAAAWLAINWPILLIVGALLGLLVLILKFPEVLGYIVGAFAVAFGHIFNMIIFIRNIFASLAEFVTNMFDHPLYSAKRLFVSFASTVLEIVKGIANAIDAVFGSSLAGGLTSLQGRMNGWLGDMPDGYTIIEHTKMMDTAELYQKGFDTGTGLGSAMKSGLDGIKDKYLNFGGMPDGFENPYYNNNDLNITGGNIDSIGKIGGEVNIAKEDLKYLLDASTRRFVNQISVEQVAPVDVNIHVSGKTQDEAMEIGDVVKKILISQAAGSTVKVYNT